MGLLVGPGVYRHTECGCLANNTCALTGRRQWSLFMNIHTAKEQVQCAAKGISLTEKAWCALLSNLAILWSRKGPRQVLSYSLRP